MMDKNNPDKPQLPKRRNLMNDLDAFFERNPFGDVLRSIDDFSAVVHRPLSQSISLKRKKNGLLRLSCLEQNERIFILNSLAIKLKFQ
ncbi:hypothetical protein NBRC111894_361 [Sporolactobacillus inulinus]|uniref:Uncharacterized protein n=1 Tax=Sporolactobacillus inulinus TaxID=2078 RepID=A0A4Y1Z6W9_9BACL|nr:hypothetical protein NBRC111894_361 [Sporolactobacillus inulinus]